MDSVYQCYHVVTPKMKAHPPAGYKRQTELFALWQ